MLATDLHGHLALVTGATGGIGKSTCRTLAALGCDVAVHYHRAAGTAEQLVAELKSMAVEAKAFQADLSNYDNVRSLHAEVINEMRPPTILFNNAGLTLKHGVKDISEISIDDFESTWRANCGSAFLLTQLCLPAMADKGWGRVVFCSSVAGFTGGVVGPHYAGITVNGVAPALIQDTAMLPGDNEQLRQKVPMGVLGRPEEVAETVAWLVKTGYVTNKVVAVDGGMFPQ